MPHHRLVAWIEPKGDHYTAAFVTAAAKHRLPATRDCAAVEEAKAWVEEEAAALRVSIIWTDPERTAHDSGKSPDAA
jgi:hypothetical protein